MLLVVKCLEAHKYTYAYDFYPLRGYFESDLRENVSKTILTNTQQAQQLKQLNKQTKQKQKYEQLLVMKLKIYHLRATYSD